jgi:hypothetical protein
VRLFLSEHTGDARPDNVMYLRLHDLKAIAQEFGADVKQVPWGPEIRLRDPDSNRLRSARQRAEGRRPLNCRRPRLEAQVNAKCLVELRDERGRQLA